MRRLVRFGRVQGISMWIFVICGEFWIFSCLHSINTRPYSTKSYSIEQYSPEKWSSRYCGRFYYNIFFSSLRNLLFSCGSIIVIASSFFYLSDSFCVAWLNLIAKINKKWILWLATGKATFQKPTNHLSCSSALRVGSQNKAVEFHSFWIHDAEGLLFDNIFNLIQ